MDSIREIYKVGPGPSSSHTIGPQKASRHFKENTPGAASFKVSLYGSLAATGKGHMTDKAILDALAPVPSKIEWHPEIVPEFHTNGMLFEAFDAQGTKIREWKAYSIGGGTISDGEKIIGDEVRKNVYEIDSLNEIQKIIEHEGYSFWEVVQWREDPQIWDFLAGIWSKMKQSIEEGLENDTIIPGCLRLRSKAKLYYRRALSYKAPLESRALVSSYALAVSEQNARGCEVVTAPTCGSCGVLPAVLYHLSNKHGFSDMDILKALATAGLFANVIKTRGSISGAEVGCQGEIGSASVMAAVACCQLFGGTPTQIEYAGEMAMEHSLGLTCDPICGLVQIPCIERNPIAALRAMDVSLYALMSDGKHLISFDKVIATMKQTGKDIPSLYKETAQGGLAKIEL